MTNEQSSVSSRRLHQAAEHVSRLWFPFNPNHFEKIRRGLKDGRYALEIDFLVQELSDDFSLLFFVIKELSSKYTFSDKDYTDLSPLDMIRLAGLDRIKKILDVEPHTISQHQLERSTSFQVARIEEALLSASTSEILAEKTDMNPELGFSTSLLRQLGITLIAWNYPTIYKRAIEAIADGEKSLDLQLSESLGFSPTLLGLTLAKQWQLSPPIREALGENSPISGTQQNSKIPAQSLKKLCEIGECLVRANAPHHYPSATLDWEEAKSFIYAQLGHEGFKLITERAKSHYQHYQVSLPDLFHQNFESDPETKISKYLEAQSIKRNPYLDALEVSLYKKYEHIYHLLSNQYGRKEAIRRIVRELVPSSEFSGALIYSVDPGLSKLVLRTRSGEITLTRSPDDKNDAVYAAFRCTTPIIGHESDQKGEMRSYISAALTREEATNPSAQSAQDSKFGVLYIEAKFFQTNVEAEKALQRFRALKRCLCDALLY